MFFVYRLICLLVHPEVIVPQVEDHYSRRCDGWFRRWWGGRGGRDFTCLLNLVGGRVKIDLS
jgi:hypothetical protein